MAAQGPADGLGGRAVSTLSRTSGPSLWLNFTHGWITCQRKAHFGMSADSVMVQTICLLSSASIWSVHSQRQRDKKYDPPWQRELLWSNFMSYSLICSD